MRKKFIANLPNFVASYFIFFLVLIIVAYPVIWMIFSAFKPSFEVTSKPFSLPTSFNLSNFISAWDTANFGRATLNSVFLVGVSIVGILLISCMGGYVFAKLKFPGKSFLFYFWLLGMMVPPYVSLIPNFVIMDRLGFIGSYLSLILIYLSSTSFGVFVMRSFFYTVPTEILEAARMDGCSELSVFWQVALPLSRGGLTVIAIFYFVFLWNDYIYPLTFLRNAIDNTIPLALMSFRDLWVADWGPMMAALSMASIPPILFYFVFQRQFIRGLTAGALKG